MLKYWTIFWQNIIDVRKIRFSLFNHNSLENELISKWNSIKVKSLLTNYVDSSIKKKNIDNKTNKHIYPIKELLY